MYVAIAIEAKQQGFKNRLHPQNRSSSVLTKYVKLEK
jgi:hypothetical protein